MDLGIAIANRHFVQRQLDAGTLVMPIDHGCHTGESYYLTWPKGRSPSRPLLNFLDWIRTQITDPADNNATAAPPKDE